MCLNKARRHDRLACERFLARCNFWRFIVYCAPTRQLKLTRSSRIPQQIGADRQPSAKAHRDNLAPSYCWEPCRSGVALGGEERLGPSVVPTSLQFWPFWLFGFLAFRVCSSLPSAKVDALDR